MDLQKFKKHRFDKWDDGTAEDLREYCKEVLKEAGLLDKLDYVSGLLRFEDGFGTKLNTLVGTSYRTAIFAVEGSSEGHYVHVEFLADEKRTCVILCKTFEGWETAIDVVAVLTMALKPA